MERAKAAIKGKGRASLRERGRRKEVKAAKEAKAAKADHSAESCPERALRDICTPCGKHRLPASPESSLS